MTGECVARTPPARLWVALALAVCAASMTHVPLAGADPACHVGGTVLEVSDLYEGSGVAASRRDRGRLFAHNDGDEEPAIVVVNDRGVVTGRIRITGASIADWEAIAVGPCPDGSCLYIADIGDNDAKRRRITLYRLPEPDASSDRVAVRDVFHATYPDGPQDAETLLATPGGDLFIVTKGETGPVALYRFPRDLRPGATVRLERVGEPRAPGRLRRDDRITDGDVSPDGRWIVLRSRTALYVHAAADLAAGNWREAGRVSLEALGEPQGEGVAFGSDSTLYLVGEGGGRRRPGTFARLACEFP